MAQLWERVLMKLDMEFGRDEEQLQTALLSNARGKSLPQVPLPKIGEALATLEAKGLAVRQAGSLWHLTSSGEREWNRREAAYDNSGGYGDYGL